MTSNDQVVVVAVTAVGWNKCDFEQTTSKIIRAFLFVNKCAILTKLVYF